MKLVADLEIAGIEIARLHEAEGDDAEYLASCERRWMLREAISATPARTLPPAADEGARRRDRVQS